jgi:hypothetical protein
LRESPASYKAFFEPENEDIGLEKSSHKMWLDFANLTG